MNRFNTPVLLILRWMFVAMFVLVVMGSQRVGLHAGAGPFPQI